MRKNQRKPEYYFDKANKNRPIRSSIPAVVAESAALASRAQIDASRAQKANAIFFGIGILAIAGTVIALLSFFESVKSNFNTTVSLASAVSDKANIAASEAQGASETVKELKTQIVGVIPSAGEIQLLRRELEDLTVKVRDLESQVQRLEPTGKK